MSDSETDDRKKRSGVLGSHSLSLFRIFGIEVRLDISVLIIFMLIVFSLGSGVLPQWHPDWSAGLIWTTAFVSGIIFFISLLAHELSHSVVSQHYGIPVPRITLFLFGGMAETSSEPERPKEEFLIALVGPLMSFVIAMVCSNAALWMAGDEVVSGLNEGNADALSQLGPVATSLLWLGMINMIIAIFNMIPGFPMDGGRVFRAVIWGVTGDQLKATRWAANMGRYFGWLLMFLGVLSVFGGQGLGGLWWILIGWFISNIASMSYQQQVSERALRGFRVSDLMRTRFDEVSPDMPLSDFVDRHLLRSTQTIWPVVESGSLQGLVSLDNISDMSEEQRKDKTVGDVMRSLSSIHYLEPDTRAREAFQQLMKAGDEPIPVISDGEMKGLIQQGDVLKWMSLHDPRNNDSS